VLGLPRGGLARRCDGELATAVLCVEKKKGEKEGAAARWTRVFLGLQGGAPQLIRGRGGLP
jgi:hypothetical protein